MIRVYVAGPYTGGDPAANVARAMDAGHQLMDAGFSPYIPHLTHFLHLHRQRSYEEWITHDLEWLARCEVLLRIPGPSDGADREVAHALKIGIRCYENIGDLLSDCEPRLNDVPLE